MKAGELKERFLNTGCGVKKLFEKLYGEKRAADIKKAARRYTALVDGLCAMDGVSADADVRVFTAAGRTEICGNHTDHNLGKVIAASVHLDIAGVAAPHAGTTVVFRSTGFPDVVVDLSDLSPRAEERGKTEALLRGIAAAFAARGAAVRGFTVNADSTVPKGSGLSSSAACEVLLAKIYDCLNGDGKTPPLELAKIAQSAENDYFGKPCGLMDQAASALGGVVSLDFGARPIETRSFTFNPEECEYVLCVVNTGGSHDDLTADYAAIPAEMKSVARFFGKNVLAEIAKPQVVQHAAEIRRQCGDRALLRALHFFNENERVETLLDCLNDMTDWKKENLKNDGEYDNLMEIFLYFIRESGDSSWEFLQNIQAGGDVRFQNLALALGLTKNFIKSHDSWGACRVHGGGFAGTIQAYIWDDVFEEYQALMEGVFGKGAVTRLFIRPVGTAELLF